MTPGHSHRSFTPALGRASLTPLYDAAIALLTREKNWRCKLIDEIAPQPGDRILDVGCGTGTLAIQLKVRCPQAEIIGLDPDPAVLKRAAAKGRSLASSPKFIQGFLEEELDSPRTYSKIACSLVLHQVPLSEKLRILEISHRLLTENGTLVLVDYGKQQGLSCWAFRMTVQKIDGVRDTQPNADGVVPRLIARAGFAEIHEVMRLQTVTGCISTWRAAKSA